MLDKVKKTDVDCWTDKGNRGVELAYCVQTMQTQHQGTVHNQTISKEVSNQSSCHDAVPLTCKKKVRRYGIWQSKTIRFSGHELHWNKMNWGFAVKWKRKRWGWHITPDHNPQGGEEYQIDSIWRTNPAAIIADARSYIAQHLQVDLEQIGENIVFPGRGIGNITGVGCRWRVVWDEYEFGYQFREVYDTYE